MKKLILCCVLIFSAIAQDSPKMDPISAIRADLAIAQRDYERLNSQCQIQLQSSDQAKRLIALLKAATDACKAAGDQILDPDRIACAAKVKPAEAK